MTTALYRAKDAFEAHRSATTAGAYFAALRLAESEDMIGDDTFLNGLADIEVFLADAAAGNVGMDLGMAVLLSRILRVLNAIPRQRVAGEDSYDLARHVTELLRLNNYDPINPMTRAA